MIHYVSPVNPRSSIVGAGAADCLAQTESTHFDRSCVVRRRLHTDTRSPRDAGDWNRNGAALFRAVMALGQPFPQMATVTLAIVDSEFRLPDRGLDRRCQTAVAQTRRCLGFERIMVGTDAAVRYAAVWCCLVIVGYLRQTNLHFDNVS